MKLFAGSSAPGRSGNSATERFSALAIRHQAAILKAAFVATNLEALNRIGGVASANVIAAQFMKTKISH